MPIIARGVWLAFLVDRSSLFRNTSLTPRLHLLLTLLAPFRLSTIQDADEIFVLDGGAVVERGNHNDLVALRGVYYDKLQQQLNTGGGALATADGALDGVLDK